MPYFKCTRWEWYSCSSQQSAWEIISKHLCKKPLIFFLATSWACGKGQEELQQTCISQHNLGTGLPSAWKDRAQWAQWSLDKLHLQQLLLPLPPIRKEMISFWRRKGTHSWKKFSHWQFLRDHSVYMFSKLELAAHRHGF